MTFNATEYLEQTGGAELKEGWNLVRIDEIITKTSAKGNQYVSVTLAAKGGKCWSNLNIGHPNPKADEIARRELATMMIACACNSVRDPMNPVELVGKYCEALLEYDGSFMRPKTFRVLEKPQAAPEPAPAPAPAPAGFHDDDIPF